MLMKKSIDVLLVGFPEIDKNAGKKGYKGVVETAKEKEYCSVTSVNNAAAGVIEMINRDYDFVLVRQECEDYDISDIRRELDNRRYKDKCEYFEFSKGYGGNEVSWFSKELDALMENKD